MRISILALAALALSATGAAAQYTTNPTPNPMNSYLPQYYSAPVAPAPTPYTPPPTYTPPPMAYPLFVQPTPANPYASPYAR